VHEYPERVKLMSKLRDMVKHFESNPSNRKNILFGFTGTSTSSNQLV